MLAVLLLILLTYSTVEFYLSEKHWERRIWMTNIILSALLLLLRLLAGREIAIVLGIPPL